MGMTFNPTGVMMGRIGKPGTPYVSGKPLLGGPGGQKPVGGDIGTAQPAPSLPPAQHPFGTLPAESVRATGTGPFDPAYRQDLATFAGGLFGRPRGDLSFNPTSQQPFGNAPVGGGSAPLSGMPMTLLQNALGGNPFSYTPPQPTQGATNNQPNIKSLQDWLNQFMQGGRGLRMAALQ